MCSFVCPSIWSQPAREENPVLTASPQMTKEQAAQALGIDLSRIDWAKLFAVLQAIIAILTQQKALARAGCSQHDQCMHDAAEHALAAAYLCLQCCEKPD